MKILVSNDDGINAPGIYALVSALKEIADVTVVAPLNEQSAVGHSITMTIPLRIIKYKKNKEFFGYAVDGTPADCVKIGVRNILNESPDLVISGINQGSNAAINIIYSGTVSAAREAAIMDIPAIAISLTSYTSHDFEYAGKVAKILAMDLVNRNLPKGTLLNVNVPAVPEDQIAGIQLTQQGKSKWDDIYEKRQDPAGRDYYWLKGNLMEVDTDIETDQAAIKNNYVSVTPIHFDLTDYAAYDMMKEWHLNNLYKKECKK
ncbi:MAG: 5'/3'-nucleotidase SurE [Bacteroidota bacterium]|nr:5'/3'-nucleotidase SurE [Bacteroidota bacterium]